MSSLHIAYGGFDCLAMFAASEFSTETRLAVRYCHPSIALCTPMGVLGLSDS